MKSFVASLAFLAFLAAPAERTWKDSSGKFTFKAELIQAEGNNVRLKFAEDGKEYDVPLHLLSSEDQEYVRSTNRAAGKAKLNNGIPDTVLRQIRDEAARVWPSNFDMQKDMIARQKKAYVALQGYSNPTIPPPVLVEIKRKASEVWPNNYDMQKDMIDRQVSAYHDLRRAE
jgi:hypothetical protein